MGLSKTSKWKSGCLHQYMAAISGSMCYTIIGTATAWPSPTLTKMSVGQTPFVLNNSEISWTVALLFLGHLTSPIPTGYLMDLIGRRRTCLLLSVLPIASWILIMVAKTAVHLYVARYAAGLWVGVTSVVIPVYVGEIADKELRSSLTTINNCLFNFGVIFVYVVGPFVSYEALAISCQAVTLVFILTFFFMPESPHFLIGQGRKEAAFAALSWLRKGEPKENIENEMLSISTSLEKHQLQKGTLKDIFYDKGNRKAFIISITFSVAKRFSGSGVLQAFTSITLPPVTMGVIDADTCVIIIGLVSFASSIVSAPLSAKFPRRVLLTISCGGCAISTATIGVWFYFNQETPGGRIPVTNDSDLVFWSLVVYYIVFNIALGPVGTSIKGEVFSANVKALSSSLNTVIVALSAFLVNDLYLIIDYTVGMYVNYVFYSVMCTGTIVFTWLFVPEMLNKSFDEIRQLFNDGRSKQNYLTNL